MHHQRPPVWPDPNDELLLRATLLDRHDALKAWKQWHAGVSYDPIDYTQQRMLPLLYNNLQKFGVVDPIMDRYRRELRHFWAINQQMYRFAAVNVQALGQKNIRTIVVKGVPLSHCYYAHPGLRPMSDVDIVVQRDDVEAATHHYLDQGWECSDSYISSFDNLQALIPIRHGFNLRAPGADKDIDLHWAIFPNSFADMQPVWDSVVTFKLSGCEMRTLSPTDQLLHACSQGAGWNIVRPIRWIPDADMILRSGAIDWDRFVEHAGRFSLGLAAADGLLVLRDLLGRPIPPDIMQRLQALPAAFSARMDYRLNARKPLPVIGRPLQRYFRYLQIGKTQRLGFAEYMKNLWGVKSFGEVVTKAVRRIWSDAIGGKT